MDTRRKAATRTEPCRYLQVDIRRKISDATEEKATRYTRRMSDHILVAFHLACDQGSFEAAEQLLKVLEVMIAYPRLPHGGSERREQKSLVAAYERLWLLRHPDPVVC
jgi:hypothetical protein